MEASQAIYTIVICVVRQKRFLTFSDGPRKITMVKNLF